MLNIGSGSTIPGKVAMKIYPQILKEFYEEIGTCKLDNQVKLTVTGTNGKTTTTGLIKSILHRDLICNNLGANLDSGITSAFIEATDAMNKLKTHNYLLEVDEASLVKVSDTIKPNLITVTNLFRDQLDRFGELDTTQKLINQGIQKVNERIDDNNYPSLVLNADDPFVASLGYTENKKIFFSVELSERLQQEDEEHALEIAKDGLIANLEKSFAQFPSEAQANIKGIILEQGFDYSLIELQTPTANIEITVKLPGIYNVYNAVAAAATAHSLGLPLVSIKEGIESYKTNFGRAEEKTIKGVGIQTFLIKNPAGATEVLKHLSHDPNAKFLIIINDNYADGRDVSWLWDADFELLKNTKTTITVSGVRAQDMALRLKYAGLPEDQIKVIPEIAEALDFSIDLCNYKNIKKQMKLSVNEKQQIERKKLYILPTYTALLNLEKIY